MVEGYGGRHYLIDQWPTSSHCSILSCQNNQNLSQERSDGSFRQDRQTETFVRSSQTETFADEGVVKPFCKDSAATDDARASLLKLRGDNKPKSTGGVSDSVR